jgi:hypothetical protein
MPTLVPMNLEDGKRSMRRVRSRPVLPGAQVIREASAFDEAAKALETAQQLSSSIKSFCKRTLGSLCELGVVERPSKTTVEFGLSISIEGNVYLVKSSGEASVKTASLSLLTHPFQVITITDTTNSFHTWFVVADPTVLTQHPSALNRQIHPAPSPQRLTRR